MIEIYLKFIFKRYFRVAGCRFSTQDFFFGSKRPLYGVEAISGSLRIFGGRGEKNEKQNLGQKMVCDLVVDPHSYGFAFGFEIKHL